MLFEQFFKLNLIYIKLLFVSLFYGGNFIAGKIVALYLPPFTASFLRYVLVLLFFYYFLSLYMVRYQRLI
jgi:drug/metabolite transporter (DMT)-like permease